MDTNTKQPDQNLNLTPPVQTPAGQSTLSGFSPISKPKPKLPRGIIIGIILFLLIAGGVVGYYSFKPQIGKLVLQPTLKEIGQKLTPVPIIPPTDQPTAGWKTFTERGGRFEFKYPSNFTLKETIGGDNNIYYATLKSTKEEFKFSSGPKEKMGVYSNFATGDKEIINGVTWIATMSQQYCDPANCDATAPGYYVVNKDFYVGVNQNDKVNDKSSLKLILSTFKFGGQTSNPTPTALITQTCTSNTDCPTGSTCMTTGPLIAGQPIKKVCSQEGVANPL